MTPDADLPLLLTTQEAAELLRTSRKAIYAMIERGQIPGVTRVGRRVLVRSDHLLKWLDQQRQPFSVPEGTLNRPTNPTRRS